MGADIYGLLPLVKRSAVLKSRLSWTRKGEDGIAREVRVQVTRSSLKWQFKRADEKVWDYDSRPAGEDWDALEEFLERRAVRGKSINMLENVRKLRKTSGA